MDKLYSARMEPACVSSENSAEQELRDPSSRLSRTSPEGAGSEIQEVSATPEVHQAKKNHKKFLLFGKALGNAIGPMKTPFVTDLQPEQSITTFSLFTKRNSQHARGKPYLRLELGDRSGTIEARMWDQFDVAAKDISRDDFVKVNGARRNLPQ